MGKKKGGTSSAKTATKSAAKAATKKTAASKANSAKRNTRAADRPSAFNDGKWILGAALSIIIFALAAWGVQNFNQFLLFDDEFGYWTGSAYLTGTDWTSVSSGIPYYSYGYGFLVLTPIRILFSTAPAMYHAAIVVNALMLVGSFWIARYVTGHLFPDVNWIFRDVLCFLCQVYPAYILFSHIAWAECTLVFTFWVFVWTSLRVIEKPSVLNHIGIALNAVILYVVHQRTLAVIIATVMVMLWMFIVERDRRKDIIIFGISLGVILFVHSLIKADLLDRYYHNLTSHNWVLFVIILAVLMGMSLFFLDKKYRRVILILAAVLGVMFVFYTFVKLDLSGGYNNNNRISINELSGQIDKLKSILTWNGFVNLLYSIMGKWFYLVMSTFLMMWWCAEECLSRTFAYFGELHHARKEHQLNKIANHMGVWYIWMALAFVGSFLIMAIYMINTNRNDVLMYGRYVEHMLGIYIIIGVMAFLQDRKWIRKTVLYVGIADLSGWLCQRLLDNLGMTTYQAYHSVYTSLFLQKDVPTYDDVIHFTVFAVIACLIVVILLKIRIWKKVNWLPKALIPLPMVVLFCYIAYLIVFGTILEKQNLRVYNIENLVTWIDGVDAGEGHNVYYCTNTESRYWSESFQFMLTETPLTLINSSEIDPNEDAFYITGDEFVDTAGYSDQFYCIKRSYQFAVSVHEGSTLAERARRIKGE